VSENLNTRQTLPSVMQRRVLVPSMCPCTIWLPSRSPTRAARQLTRDPAATPARVDIAIVSAITSAVNQSSPLSTTV
jgi:hypothetical protein